MTRSTSRRTVVAAGLATPFAVAIGSARAQHATPAPSSNEALVRSFYEPFNTGDTSVYDTILAADWADHPLNPGQKPGPAGFVPIVAGFRTVFPDLSITNEDVLVAGDKVTVRSTARGTQKGAILGIPPTSKRVEFMTIDIHRVADGVIAETWHIEDYLSLIAQLGATIAPPSATTSITG